MIGIRLRRCRQPDKCCSGADAVCPHGRHEQPSAVHFYLFRRRSTDTDRISVHTPIPLHGPCTRPNCSAPDVTGCLSSAAVLGGHHAYPYFPQVFSHSDLPQLFLVCWILCLITSALDEMFLGCENLVPWLLLLSGLETVLPIKYGETERWETCTPPQKKTSLPGTETIADRPLSDCSPGPIFSSTAEQMRKKRAEWGTGGRGGCKHQG